MLYRQLGLQFAPGCARLGYIRAILLGGVERLFLSVSCSRSQNRQTVP
jgi:hypothetical protein